MTILAAIEINWSGSLKIGGVSMTAGVAGVASWLIPALLVTMAAAMWFQPHLRVVVGVATILFALASFQTSNLGGWFIGMLMGIVGGSLAIAWDVDKPSAAPSETSNESEAAAPPAEESNQSDVDGSGAPAQAEASSDSERSLTDDLVGEQRRGPGA